MRKFIHWHTVIMIRGCDGRWNRDDKPRMSVFAWIQAMNQIVTYKTKTIFCRFSAILVIFKNTRKCPVRQQTQHIVVVEARDPFKWASHINVNQISQVSQPSNAVDVQMYESLLRYCQSCQTIFWKLLPSMLGQQCSVLVEVVDPSKMTPTALSNTYKVFHNP